MARGRDRLRPRGFRAALWLVPTVAAAVVACVITTLIAVTAIAGSASGSEGGGCEAAETGTVQGAPAELVPIYEQAAARFGLGQDGPAILAAINWVETGYGANLGPSSAGAVGWMQFMPETWAAYGVDADRDGDKDPDDPWDAIFAAARLLRASGAPRDWHAAIFSYNHAEWYVAKVLAKAEQLRGEETVQLAAAARPAASCAPVSAPEAVRTMIAEADRIDALHLTYVWGGSHGQTPTPSDGPFDCSSAVSHLLQVAGFRNPTMTTSGLISWGEAGAGQMVTFHVKPSGPDAHTFLEFAPSVAPPSHRYWGTSTSNPGGGPGWIPASMFSADYLAGFEPRHPPGL